MSKGNNNLWKKRIIASVTVLGGLYAALGYVAEKNKEPEEIDEGNLYIQPAAASKEGHVGTPSMYAEWVKPVFDKALSFMALLFLSPIFALVSIAIFIDDPGPVFFTQKRVGKNKKFFTLHKFRSMKMSTPHDVPTHQLRDPEQYITKVGKVLRKTSLDELPQIWDIFRGKMSIIGPRPALWNQEDLVAEREKYGANDVMPGLTGLAQISGRDELLIPDKAALDGIYVKILKQGGLTAFVQDFNCLTRTVGNVIKHDGVVEGGTGSLPHLSAGCSMKNMAGVSIPIADETGFEDYGCYKTFQIDKNRKVKVLITGADSYIGENFRVYAAKNYPNISVDTIDMKDGSWRIKNFEDYDCVFHVAGIAHADINCIDDITKAQYYAINTDLAIETAQKAKNDGVKQFIFMSSIIVYGDSASDRKKKIIDAYTIPAPSNVYGDSKWQADKGVRKLQTNTFHVAVLRSPMIYGRGVKGHYSTLAKLARKLLIFPDVENRRSMLYIENLCEFLSQLVISGAGGVYFPQNSSYVKTTDMVELVSAAAGKKIKRVKVLNPAVTVAQNIPGKIGKLTGKAFGDLIYEHRLSDYEGLDYQKISFAESIRLTEGIGAVSDISSSFSTCGSGGETGNQKRALMLASVASMIDLFNTDNINILEKLGYKVDVAANFDFGSITSQKRVDEYRQELIDRGIVVHNIPIPRDLSMLKEMGISYRRIKDLVNKNHYDIIHCHSPIGGVLCRLASRKARERGSKIVYTAHGFHFFKGANKKAWMIYYPVERLCAHFTDIIVTVNHEDYKAAKQFKTCKVVYVPGIGIHVDEIKNIRVDREIKRAEFGYKKNDFVFMSTGQVSIRKNHEVVIRALKLIKDLNVKYLIVGFGEEEERLKALVRKLGLADRVAFAGYRSDVKELLHCVDAYVFPSIQEGLPVALMEAMAAGLPVVCSRIRGNVDLISDGKGGYLVKHDDPVAFASAMKQIISSDTNFMSAVNQKKIIDFDSNMVCKKMEKLYRSIKM